MVRRDGGQRLQAAGDASGPRPRSIASGAEHAIATRRLRPNCESRDAVSPATGCWAPRTMATPSSAASGWSTTGARSPPSNPVSPSSSQSAATIAAPSMPSFRRRLRSAPRDRGGRRSRPVAGKTAGRASDQRLVGDRHGRTGTGLLDFRHFWREVPDSLHIGAYPCISAPNTRDLANHESPANGV